MGYDSCLFFLIQRNDCDTFKIASDIDLDYFENLKIAIKNKVKIIAYNCKFLKNGIVINKKVRIKI